jgi:hypothetical protein
VGSPLLVVRKKAMATLNRIVLLDTTGDELFSGSSVLAACTPRDVAPQAADPVREEGDDDEESCPETLRSSVFARAHAEPALL